MMTVEQPKASKSPLGNIGNNYTPNDMRSNTLNQNNPAYKAAADNRSNQMNSNHKQSKGRR
ncbi:MAG TPA: hypothetical protein VFA15_04960 [Nitrososphaera sp.]|nr:hypothetical protein [Nitrososphaera sp.]